jgi:hypothetical protein
VAFNLTLLSYNGSLDMGLNIDPVAVAEPDRLRDEMVRSFDRAVAPRRRGGRRSGGRAGR